MSTVMQWLEPSRNPSPVASSGAQLRIVRRFVPLSLGPAVLGTALGVASAVVALMTASLLPQSQMLNALAALAAGVAVPLVWLSLDDDLTARALFRAGIAAGMGVLAYQALAGGWLLLALAYLLGLSWVVMDWIDRGAAPARLGLTSGLATLAIFSLSLV